MSASIPVFTYQIRNGRKYGRSQQRGAALVMALVVLLILTIIGITALNTTSLEAKMANNLQETNRTFTAAESALAKSMKTAGATFKSGNTTTSAIAPIGGVTVSVVTTDLGTKDKPASTPKRGSGFGNGYDSYNFEQVSTASSTNNAGTVIHQGVSLMVSKQ